MALSDWRSGARLSKVATFISDREGGIPNHDLQSSQTRCLVSTFKYMDRSLGDAFLAATGEANDQASCPEYVLDVTSAQQIALKAQLVRFRDALRDFLERQQITVEASTSATAAFRTAIEFVQISLYEIRPKGLTGFGALSPQGAAEITRLIDELSEITADMMTICRGVEPSPQSE